MRYQPPVPANTEITSGYGPRHDPRVHQEPGGHPGIDYPMPVGTTVTAAADGIIERASDVKGYGLTVIVKHADGYHSLYGHLDSASVKVGDKVHQGEEIGKSGNSGASTGPHLHFSVLRDVNIPEHGPLGFKVNVGNTVNPTELYSESLLDQLIGTAHGVWDTLREIVSGAEGGAPSVKTTSHGKAHGGAKPAVPAHASATPTPADSIDDSQEEWSLPEPTPASTPESVPSGSDHEQDERYELSPLSQEERFERHDEDRSPAWHHADSEHADPMETAHGHGHSHSSGNNDSHHHSSGGDSHHSSSHSSGGDHGSWSNY